MSVNIVIQMYKLNKPFPPQLAFWSWSFIAAIITLRQGLTQGPQLLGVALGKKSISQ